MMNYSYVEFFSFRRLLKFDTGEIEILSSRIFERKSSHFSTSKISNKFRLSNIYGINIKSMTIGCIGSIILSIYQVYPIPLCLNLNEWLCNFHVDAGSWTE